MLPRSGEHASRLWSVVVAALTLAVVLGTLAVFIAGSQGEERRHLIANFKLRGSSSATLVSTYIAQQAQRQRESAEQLMSVPTVTRSRFRTIATAFGAQSAALLDADGVVLNVYPAQAGRVGESVVGSYPAARRDERTSAVSDVLPGRYGLPSVATISVPFESDIVGRRVFAASYGVGGTQLGAFVDHAIAYKQHEVLLLDSRGALLASSPRTTARTIAGADRPLADALATGNAGAVPGAREPSTFTVARVPGTPWRMVLMVPDSTLYSTVSGTTELIPWLVFALVTLLGLALVLLFARSLADRSRLAVLSGELESIARTDPLTGLLNRRGIEEDLTRAFEQARRREEPMTLLMIDLDRFKEVNDRYGHEAGDRVLLLVAGCMRDALRTQDVYGRVGGDEFVVAMTGADETAGRAAAERLQAQAAAVDLSDLGLDDGIPMSVGLASAVLTTPEDLMRAADAELYRAKGRRRAGALQAPAATAG